MENSKIVFSCYWNLQFKFMQNSQGLNILGDIINSALLHHSYLKQGMIGQCKHVCTSAEEFKSWKRALILQIEGDISCIMCHFFQPLLNVWRTKSLLTWLFDIKKESVFHLGFFLREYDILKQLLLFPSRHRVLHASLNVQVDQSIQNVRPPVLSWVGGHYDVHSSTFYV